VCLIIESFVSKMEYLQLLKRVHVSCLHFAIRVFSAFPHFTYVIGKKGKVVPVLN
jgi:hypothetical protein